MGPYYQQQQQQQQQQTLRGRHVTVDDGTTITLPQHGGRRKKRKMNHAGHATAARKRSKATSKRDLPTGVYKRSGKYQSQIYLGDMTKTRYIGRFDTPEQASAAFMFVRKDVGDAKLSGLGPDEVNAAFDAAKEKAIDAVGGVGPKKKKRKATSLRGHPLGFTQNATGKFVSQMYWGGKNRYIGTFDTADQASTVSWLMRKYLGNANLSAAGADKVDAAFDTAKLHAIRAVGGSNSRRKTAEATSGQDLSTAAVGGQVRKKSKYRARSWRDLPTGVCKVSLSGKFQAAIWWGGKQRYISTFDTPEKASSAIMFMKKDLDDANLWALGADEVDAAFDAAKKKALEAVGKFL